MLLFINRSALEEAFISPIRRWVCVLISMFGQAKPQGLVSMRHDWSILFILNIKPWGGVIFCYLLYYVFLTFYIFLYVHRIKLTTLTNGLYSDRRQCSSFHGSPFFQRLSLTNPQCAKGVKWDKKLILPTANSDWSIIVQSNAPGVFTPQCMRTRCRGYGQVTLCFCASTK